MKFFTFFSKLLIFSTILLNTRLVNSAFVNVIPTIINSTINKSTNYSFSVFLSHRIQNSDKIVINFPSQVTLPNGDINCIVSSYSDQTLSAVKCSGNSNILSITTSSTKTDPITNLNIYISLNILIKNAPSIYSDYFSLYLYDSANNILDYNDNFKPNYSSSIITNGLLTSTSSICSDLANFTFSFTPSDPILKGGSIRIYFPNYDLTLGSVWGNSPLDTQTKQSLTVLSGIDSSSYLIVTMPFVTINNIFPNANSDTTTKISFVINNMLNPPSTELFTGISLSTYDALGYQIQINNNSYPISLQMTKAASITKLILNSSTFVINQSADLTFNLFVNNVIPVGAIFEIIIPSEFTTNSIVKLSNVVQSYTLPNTPVSFTVSGLINPASTEPTGNFKLNIYTQNNYLMSSFTDNVNYLPTPGSFTNVLITQSSSVTNAINDLTVSFVNNDIIFNDSYITIQIPAELSIQNYNEKLCDGILSGITLTALCSIKTNKLTIKNFNQIPKNSNLSLIIRNVGNYYCVKPTSSFAITSYTSKNYLIDSISDGLSVNFTEGSLVAPTLTQSSKVNSAESTYLISFQNQNQLVANSEIVVGLPGEVSIKDKQSFIQNCTITTGGTLWSSKCTLSANGSIIFANFNSAVIPSLTNFTLKLPSLVNPRSFKTSSSFNITTQTPDGFKIDKTTVGLVATNNIQASTQSVTVLASSLVTGDVTDYSFSIVVGGRIESTDVLLITIPQQISITQNFSIIGLTNATFSVANGSNIVSISLNLTNTLKPADILSFTLKGLKNPPSLKPSDNFLFKFVTYDQFNIEQYSNLNVTMATPNTLQQTYVKGINIKKNTTTDYLVQFLPVNIIPKNGIILINYPEQIQVVDGKCLAQLGVQSSINCQVDASNRLIKITNLFAQDFLPSLIQFTIKGLANKMPLDLTNQTDTFQIFTTTQDGYLIDLKIDGLNIIFNCISPCQTCQGDTTTCLSCFSSSPLPLLQEGKCVNQCTSGYSQNGSVTDCSKCNPMCGTCLNFSVDKCTSCPISTFLHQNSCVSSCPDGYYKDTKSNTCTMCTLPCAKCKSDTECLSCATYSTLHLYQPTTNKCLSECPDGFFKSNNDECLVCDRSCQSCIDLSSKCTSCPTGQVMLENKCYDQMSCPTGYYADINELKCLKCDSNCKECGKSFQECRSCIEGFTLDERNYCLPKMESCEPGAFLNSNNLCQSCDASCKTCTDEKICATCHNDQFLQSGSCVSSCSDGYFFDTENCSSCGNTCKTCKGSATECFSCQDKLFLYNSDCLETCPDGLKINSTTKSCDSCTIQNCSKCYDENSLEVCQSCEFGFFFHQNKCYSICPENYINDFLNNNCRLNSTQPDYSQSNSFTNTYFLFFISAVIINFYIFLSKVKYGHTYFFGSCIAVTSFLKYFHNIVLINSAFSTGYKLFFSEAIYILVMSYVLNCAFIIVYEFYTNKDKEFIYWKSDKKLISGLFYFTSLLMDYKTIRLFYSRFRQFDSFDPKFNDFNKIHNPFRKILITEIIIISIPHCILLIYFMVKAKSKYEFWYNCIENLLMLLLLTALELIDLNVNIDLNDDFYNQKVKDPDIVPYEYGKSKDRMRIDKRFDFEKVDNKNIQFKSIIQMDEKRLNKSQNNPFAKSLDNYEKLKKIFDIDAIAIAKFIDDTRISYNSLINYNRKDKKNFIERFSSGFKNLFGKFSFSPNMKIYNELRDENDNYKAIKEFDQDVNNGTPNFNDLDKTDRSNFPLKKNNIFKN